MIASQHVIHVVGNPIMQKNEGALQPLWLAACCCLLIHSFIPYDALVYTVDRYQRVYHLPKLLGCRVTNLGDSLILWYYTIAKWKVHIEQNWYYCIVSVYVFSMLHQKNFINKDNTVHEMICTDY